MSKSNLNFVPNFFRDKNHKIVIAQTPNAPIIIWALTRVYSTLNLSAQATHSLEQISSAFLIVWAYLEITSGSSSFRRVLGTIVMISTLVGFFK
jgi:hypothetical protein